MTLSESPPNVPPTEQATSEASVWGVIKPYIDSRAVQWLVLFLIFLWFKEFLMAVLAASLTLPGLLIAGDFLEGLDMPLDLKDTVQYRIDPGIGAGAVGVLTFAITWIYCMSTYGFLLGFGLGWLPAYILATILMFLWRVVALVVIGFALVATLSI